MYLHIGDSFNVKNSNDGFVSYKHMAFCVTRHSLKDWSGVDYLRITVKVYQLFGL